MKKSKRLPAFPPMRVHELGIAFQPVVLTSDEAIRVVAYESFLRIGNPWCTSSLVELISAAELDRSIVELDSWVMDEVCHRLYLNPELKVWMNSSQISLASPDFITESVEKALSLGVRDRLTIEMTESADGDLASLRRNLAQLQIQAIAVVLDDIHDGYAKRCLLDSDAVLGCKFSLETKRLMQVDAGTRRAVVDLTEWCHRHGKTVVMEGIETPADFRMARDMGIGLQQGFLFARPRQFEDLAPVGSTLPFP